jgi:hypothetical protein
MIQDKARECWKEVFRVRGLIEGGYELPDSVKGPADIIAAFGQECFDAGKAESVSVLIWRDRAEKAEARILALEAALHKINLGRHGSMTATDMALVAWVALDRFPRPEQEPAEKTGKENPVCLVCGGVVNHPGLPCPSAVVTCSGETLAVCINPNCPDGAHECDDKMEKKP